MKTHFTWSIETPQETCPTCGMKTIFIVSAGWAFADDDGYVNCPDGPSVDDEVSGHWCPECNRLVSLSLNTVETPTPKGG